MGVFAVQYEVWMVQGGSCPYVPALAVPLNHVQQSPGTGAHQELGKKFYCTLNVFLLEEIFWLQLPSINLSLG